MNPVQAHLRESHDDLKSPGDFMFTAIASGDDRPHGMIYLCPCGCGDKGFLLIDRPDLSEDDRRRPKWTWNGSRERPTLKPSIRHTVGCRFHGWLTDGVFSST